MITSGLQSRVARLALLEPKNRNLALLWSTCLQNFIWLLFGSFATFSLHKFFLKKSCEWRVCRVACPHHHKTRCGPPPHSCANEHPGIPLEVKEDEQAERATFPMQCSVNLSLLCTAFFYFSVWIRHEIHWAQAHTVSTGVCKFFWLSIPS